MSEALNHTGRRSSVSLFLAGALAALCLVLPLAHARALHNSLAGLVVLGFVACLLAQRSSPFSGLPRCVLWSAGAWVGICFASAAWSPWPLMTLELTLGSVALPFVLFLAGQWLARERACLPVVVWGGYGGLLILVFLVAALLWHGEIEALSSGLDFKLAGFPVLRRYPGPGLMSSFVILGLPLTLFVAQVLRWRRLSAVMGGLLLIAGIVSFNRMFWPALAGMLAVGLGFAAARERFALKARHFLAAGLVAAIVVLGVLGSTAVRVKTLGGQALDLPQASESVGQDPRFVIWDRWLEAGRAQAWLGVGFGKETARRSVASAFEGIAPGDMDPAGRSHPHNLLLSIWIQLGFLGLAAFLWLVASILFYAWRRRDHPAAMPLAMLVTGLLLKNLTDDFYDVALPSLFWIYAGLMSGSLSSTE